MGKVLIAEAALEALGPVCAHVDVQRALLGEALAANGALESADAGVGHHVFQEVIP